MTKCDAKCRLNWDTRPSFFLNGLLLTYIITTLILKITMKNHIFNFIFYMLTVLAFSIISEIVLEAFEYKTIDLYIELFPDGIYTPDLSVE